MNKLNPTVGDNPLPQLSEADIVTRLNEAEADETEGRLTDGVALISDLRSRADGLQAKIDRRRA